uniref:Uncharacterized protein n=2 Tax=Acrobeloides nanus TaxID=290746 RepID=A0A914ECB0_9BILA
MPKRPFAKDENSGSPKPEKSHDSYVFPEDAQLIPYEEALEEILEEEAMDILPDWDNRYLGALLAHLMKHGCEEKSIEKFTEKFKIGGKEEIMERISQLREVNHKAYQRRFNITSENLKKYCGEQPSTSTLSNTLSKSPQTSSNDRIQLEQQPNGNWLEALWTISKDRRIPDTSQMALPRAFQNCAKHAKLEEKTICNDVFVKSNKFVADVNYKTVYEYLAMLLDSRTISRVHSLEASVLLSVFDELEKTVQQQFPELREAWSEIFKNLHHMQAPDFKPSGLLTPENIGEKAVNVLGMPKELLDLNRLTSDQIKRK